MESEKPTGTKQSRYLDDMFWERPGPWFAGSLFLLTVFVLVAHAWWGLDRSGAVFSLIFCGIVGWMAAVVAICLGRRRDRPDLVQILSGAALVLTLFISWHGGPGAAISKMNWAPPGHESEFGWTIIGVFFGTVYLAAYMWPDRTQ